MAEEDNLVKELNLNCSPIMEMEPKLDPPEGDLINLRTEKVKNVVAKIGEIVAATHFEESEESEDPMFGNFMKISQIIEQEKKNLELLREEQEKLKEEIEAFKEEINTDRQFFRTLCVGPDKTKTIGDDIKNSMSITDNLLNEFLSSPSLPDWVRAPFENEIEENKGLKSMQTQEIEANNVGNNDKQGEEDASKKVSKASNEDVFEDTMKMDNKDASDDIIKKIMKEVRKDEGNEVMEMTSKEVVDGIYQGAAKDAIKESNYEPNTSSNIETIDKVNKNISIKVINETQKGAKNHKAPEVANSAEFSELANNDEAPAVANKNDKIELNKEILKEAMISVPSDDSSNNIHSMNKEYIIAQVILQQDNKTEKKDLKYEDKATVPELKSKEISIDNGNVEKSNADEKFDLEGAETVRNTDLEDF